MHIRLQWGAGTGANVAQPHIFFSSFFPIKLNTPPRSPVEWDGSYQTQPRNGNGNGNGSKSRKNQRQPNHHRIKGSVSASSFGHSSFGVSMSRGEADDGDEDDDSFARELQVTARADQHIWVQHRGRQKAMQAKKKFVPSLRPPTKDVEHVTEKFADFDSGFCHNNTNNTNTNINKDGNRQQEDRLGFIGSMPGSRSRQEGDGIEMMHRGQIQMQKNSSPPMSYLPTNLISSQSRFQTRSQYQPNGSAPNSRDGMDAYLLNPIPAGDDDSFGNSSGMEMSLGTNTQASGVRRQAFLQKQHRGLYKGEDP